MIPHETLWEGSYICFGYDLVKNLPTIISTLDEAYNIETEKKILKATLSDKKW